MPNCSDSTGRYKFVPLDLALQFEALAAERGVSKVARGEQASTQTEGGFFQAAKRAGGRIEKLCKMPVRRGSDQTWWQRRNAFCKRHSAQQRARNEPIVEKNGKYKGTPTRRELGMLMWMCSNLSVPELRKLLPAVQKITKSTRKA